MKTFNVTIELEIFETTVKAKNKTEAKQKAIAKLKQKDASRLIRTSFGTHKKEIDIEEI